jgi:hypothetical protein
MTIIPNVKLKALTSFPSTVTDGVGIEVVKTNGSYQLNVDFSDFAPATASVVDASSQSALIWNETTDSYSLLLLSAFSTGLPGSALPKIDGTATAGVSGLYSREDHVHPTDTTRAPIDSPVFTTAASAPTPAPGDNDTSIATTAFVTAALAASAVTFKNYMSGLTLSTAGASATFGIAAGMALDSANTVVMTLASAYTKTTSAWAVGTGNGALDTGVISAAAWYHVFLIRRSDTGVVDVLISLSPTAPTMPPNYGQFRRIGSMLTAASLWTAFTQIGDKFYWNTSVLDLNSSAITTARTLVPMTCPPSTTATFRCYMFSGSAGVRIVLQSVFETDAAPNSAAAPVLSLNAEVLSQGVAGHFELPLDASSQIAVRASAASTTVRIATLGWIDRRGRDG